MLFDCRNLDLKVGQTVFFYADGKREVITGGKHARITSQIKPEVAVKVEKVVSIVKTNKCDKTCIVCGASLADKREGSKTCSARCRQAASRKNKQLELIK